MSTGKAGIAQTQQAACSMTVAGHCSPSDIGSQAASGKETHTPVCKLAWSEPSTTHGLGSAHNHHHCIAHWLVQLPLKLQALLLERRWPAHTAMARAHTASGLALCSWHWLTWTALHGWAIGQAWRPLGACRRLLRAESVKPLQAQPGWTPTAQLTDGITAVLLGLHQ